MLSAIGAERFTSRFDYDPSNSYTFTTGKVGRQVSGELNRAERVTCVPDPAAAHRMNANKI